MIVQLRNGAENGLVRLKGFTSHYYLVVYSIQSYSFLHLQDPLDGRLNRQHFFQEAVKGDRCRNIIILLENVSSDEVYGVDLFPLKRNHINRINNALKQ